MWEALLMLRLIASVVPRKLDRRVPLGLPVGFFKGSIRLAYADYHLSLPPARTTDTGKNNDEKNIA